MIQTTARTSPSSHDLKYRRPSLCGYCRGLASPMFVMVGNKMFGGCSLDHLDKIKRGEKMQEIKNFAQVSEEGLDYALGKSKDIYLDTKKETGSFELHKWSKEQRLAFVHSLVRSYLNHQHSVAETGLSVDD